MHRTQQLGHQLASNFLSVSAGTYAAMAMSLVINAAIARHVGVEQFGGLALLLTASQVLAFIGVNWTQTAFVRFGAQEFAATDSIAAAFWARVLVVLPWVAAGAVALAIWSGPLADYLSVPEWGLWIIAGHFVASFMLTTMGAALQATNQMRRYALMLLAEKVVLAALLLATLTATANRSPLLILAVYACSSALVAFWTAVQSPVHAFTPVRFDKVCYGQMLAFSLPLLLSSWVGLLGTHWFDILILKHFRPMADVGLYSLGTVVAGVVQQVTIVFSTLLLPQVSMMASKGELQQIRFFIERALPYWFLATAVLFTSVLLVVGPLVPLIFGRSFKAAAPVIAVLMLGSSALAIFNAFSPIISGLGATWVITGIYLTAGVTNVLLDLALIPTYGILGAAYATVAAYGASAGLSMLFVQRRLGSRVFPLVLMPLPVAATCFLYLALDLFAFYIVAIPVGASTILWLLRRFHLFRGEDAAYFRRVWMLSRPAPDAPSG